jgi:hypothetical protein
LSPPPEESMATRQSIPRVAKDKQIVLPTESKEEAFKFGTASSWGREHLDILGVDFPQNRRIDLNRILKIGENDWPPELRASEPSS